MLKAILTTLALSTILVGSASASASVKTREQKSKPSIIWVHNNTPTRIKINVGAACIDEGDIVTRVVEPYSYRRMCFTHSKLVTFWGNNGNSYWEPRTLNTSGWGLPKLIFRFDPYTKPNKTK